MHGTFFPRSWMHTKIPASCQRWSGWGCRRGAESPPTPGEWALSWMISWRNYRDDVMAATHEQKIKGMPTVGRKGSRMWEGSSLPNMVFWYSIAESHRWPLGYLQTHPGYAQPMQKWPCRIIDSLLSQLEHSSILVLCLFSSMPCHLLPMFRMTGYKTWHCSCPSGAWSEGTEKYSAYHGYYSELALQFVYRHEHDQGVSDEQQPLGMTPQDQVPWMISGVPPSFSPAPPTDNQTAFGTGPDH